MEETRPVFDGNSIVIARLALTYRGNTTGLWPRSDCNAKGRLKIACRKSLPTGSCELRRHHRHEGLVVAAECLYVPLVSVRSETHSKKSNIVEMNSCLGLSSRPSAPVALPFQDVGDKSGYALVDDPDK